MISPPLKTATSRRIQAIFLAATLLPSPARAAQSSGPCEEYNHSSAVFFGTAGARVIRIVQLDDQPPVPMMMTPFEVEQTYLGVPARVVYVMSLGVQTFATPGERYLVYGRQYQSPDIVAASPGIGMKEIAKADDDLSFLESRTSGSTIVGEVAHRGRSGGGTTNAPVPVAGVPIRILSETHSTETRTDGNGRFTARELPAGGIGSSPTFPTHSAWPIRRLQRRRWCARADASASRSGQFPTDASVEFFVGQTAVH